MAQVAVGSEATPVGGVAAAQVRGNILGAPAGVLQLFLQLLLGGLHAGVAALRCKPAGEQRLRAPVKVAQQSCLPRIPHVRSEEHTSELQSLMRISYAVFCLKKNT